MTYSIFGPLLYEMTSYFNFFFIFFAWSDYSKALSPTSGGLIFIVHSIFIWIGHLSSMLNKLEKKKYPGQDGASNKNFRCTKRAIARQ